MGGTCFWQHHLKKVKPFFEDFTVSANYDAKKRIIYSNMGVTKSEVLKKQDFRLINCLLPKKVQESTVICNMIVLHEKKQFSLFP